MRNSTGDPNFRSRLTPVDPLPLYMAIGRALQRPLKMLFMHPVISLLAILSSFTYGCMVGATMSYLPKCFDWEMCITDKLFQFLFLATLSSAFTTFYGFSTKTVGIVYLGLAIGFLVGVGISATVNERLIKRLSDQKGKKPEHRMMVLLYWSPFVPIGLLLYGWTIQARIFFIVPVIGTVLVGIGLVVAMVCYIPLIGWPFKTGRSSACQHSSTKKIH